MDKKNKITRVHTGSLAQEIGLKEGDRLLAVNGVELLDIIDLSFTFADEEIELLVEHPDKSTEIIAFDKDYDEELGVELEAAVFDGIRTCANKCCFCFVEQIGPDMRETLSIRDDDYRMSFLYGNFVTMTNMGPRDFERIKKMHLSPLYISIHATNPKLRAEMMGNPRAAILDEQLEELAKINVTYHAQVVLCPGINDGAELERTIKDMAKKRPHAHSLAIVPVGLTKFRDGCYPLSMFTKEAARAVVAVVEKYQKQFRQEGDGTSFVYLSDEFYLIAELPVPKEHIYDGFPQLENGIGLTRNFLDEWENAAQKDTLPHFSKKKLHLAIICGISAEPVFQKLLAENQFAHVQTTLLALENNYFGKTVTVSGLLTASDILTALELEAKKGRYFDGVIIPASALRAGEDIFLDNMSLEELRKKIPAEVKIAEDGGSFYHLLTDWEHCPLAREHQTYTWQSNAAYTK